LSAQERMLSPPKSIKEEPMNHRCPKTCDVCALVAVLFLWARPAYAYLDPGSGSMLLQLLLGGIAGLVVIIKLYWHQLLVRLGIRKQDPPASHPS